MAEKETQENKITYLVKFYDGALGQEHILFSYQSFQAPYAFLVGDIVNPSGWGGKNQLPEGGLYKIISIEHQLSIVDSPDSTEIQHNIVISLAAIISQGIGMA